MKLTQKIIHREDLQDYLDKYQEKIKFILPFLNLRCYILVIDES